MYYAWWHDISDIIAIIYALIASSTNWYSRTWWLSWGFTQHHHHHTISIRFIQYSEYSPRNKQYQHHKILHSRILINQNHMILFITFTIFLGWFLSFDHNHVQNHETWDIQFVYYSSGNWILILIHYFWILCTKNKTKEVCLHVGAKYSILQLWYKTILLPFNQNQAVSSDGICIIGSTRDLRGKLITPYNWLMLQW